MQGPILINYYCHSFCTLTSCESPSADPMNTTPLSKYVRQWAIEVWNKKKKENNLNCAVYSLIAYVHFVHILDETTLYLTKKF